MIRAIFRSNMIERAGLGLDITTQLCRQVFAGEEPETIPKRDVAYQDALLDAYCQMQPELRGQSAQYI